jgi:hypothetical protein
MAGMRTWQRALWALAVVALAAGCASGAERESEREPQRPAPAPPLVEPVDAVMRPKRLFDNLETIERVTQRLANACMERKGLHPSEMAQLVDRVQGQLSPDMAYARSEGYGFSHYLRGVWQVDDEDADDWYAAYRGTEDDQVRWKTIAGSGSNDSGGCIGEARNRVAGSGLDWFWAAHAHQDYWLVTAAAMNQDPRWDAAVRRWVPCMAEAGYPDLGGPMGAWKRARREVFAAHESEGRVSAAVRAAEVELAVADGECQLSTGMVDVQREIRIDFLDDAPPEFLRDLDRIAEAQRAALETIATEGLDQ